MKKIAFVGAHSSGKTTVFTAVKKIFGLDTIVKALEEEARNCPYPINDKATFQTAHWILSQQINSELNAMQDAYDFILCDRSVYDAVVYWKYMVHKESCNPYGTIRNKIEYAQQYNYLQTVAEAWAHLYPYDYIFLFEPLIPVINDGIRNTDPNYQLRIAELFREYMPTVTHNLTIINQPTRGERINAVEYALYEIMKNDA